MKGQPIWTAEEDNMCRKIHPDYKALIKVLKIRSYSACRSHCQKLGLAPTRHLWTALDRMKLRKLYPAGSREELLGAFPGRTHEQIARAARYYRIHRKRKPYQRTGITALDTIRDKAFECGYCMHDVDAIAKTKNYFAKANWHTGHISHRAIGRAIEALDGKITAEWND